jgi:L-histidine N-alpha-methyltransferase
VTAEFNLNVLRRMNRELQADFDVEAFQHEARWDAATERIEMHLRSLRPQVVTIRDAGVTARFAGGESLRTEVCTKYTRSGVEALLAEVGITAVQWYSDASDRFGLLLAR